MNLKIIAMHLHAIAEELAKDEESKPLSVEEPVVETSRKDRIISEIMEAMSHFNNNWSEFNKDIDAIVVKYNIKCPWINRVWGNFMELLEIPRNTKLKDYVSRKGYKSVYDFIDAMDYRNKYMEVLIETLSNE